MAAAESMKNIGDGELDFCDFAGLEGLGLFEAVAELATKDVATDELLITAHFDVSRIRFGIVIVPGIDVDEFDDPIGVGASGGDVQRGDERTGESEVVVERFGFINEDVRTRRSEALVVDGIGARIIGGDFHCEGNWFGRIADVFVESIGRFARRIEVERALGAEIELSG